MLEVSITATNLDDLDERMRRAISRKMTQLTDLLYDKVIENLSGRVLQQKSGELIETVRKQRDRMSGGVINASVFMSPESPKAWALEVGGKGYYPIVPTKASILKFYWEKVGQIVYLHSVNHPPSRAFGYLRLAAEEVEPLIPEKFSDLVQLMIAGEGEE
jgi:hypothetical protein